MGKNAIKLIHGTALKTHTRPATFSYIMTSALVITLTFLSEGVYAYTRFNTTCTVPKTFVNYVSSPDSRGTLDILWSCLFTILACTWTIQHLNIPEQRDRSRERKDGVYWVWYDFKWWVKGFWTNLKWMVFTIVAPEIILGKAIGDLYAAWDLKKEMKKVDHEVEWGLSHGFFAFMGGFRVVVRDDGNELDDEQKQPQTRVSENPQNENSRPGPDSALDDVVGSYVLLPDMFLDLRKKGDIPRLPNITKEEIHDKSKANIFVKALAVIQVFWMCVQVIVRHTRGLAISQLELVVTAFSVCAILTYLFLIPKPQGVQVPMRPIRLSPSVFTSAKYPIISPLREMVMPNIENWSGSLNEDYKRRSRVPNDFAHGRDELLVLYPFGMTIGGIIFGAIHVAGWNLHFPTPVEQKLWRIASILATSLLPLALFPVLFITTLVYFEAKRAVSVVSGTGGIVVQWWGLVFGWFYIIVRLFLFVETFRTLAFLPPDAFVATWVSNIPYVG